MEVLPGVNTSIREEERPATARGHRSATREETAQGTSPSSAKRNDRIPVMNSQSPSRLSFAQERIWFWDQVDQNSALYNVPIGLRLRGALDIVALEKSLTNIIVRHQSLRTNFISDNGLPLQVVAENRRIALSFVDLKPREAVIREKEARRLMEEEARRPFNLSRDLLIRASLYALDDECHFLLITTHHIIFDLWSLGILFRELEKIYPAYASGTSPDLPDLPIQYPDFAAWQREELQGNYLESLISFWKKQIAGCSEFHHLAPDHSRPARQTYRGARTEINLGEGLITSLTDLGHSKGATMFMILLAAFQAILHRYSGHDDVVVGYPIANRNRPETTDLIGFFANTLVFRSDFSANPSFLDLLAAVRETALASYPQQDLPFEKLVEAVQPARSSSHSPLFQTMIVFLNVATPLPHWPGLEISRLDVETGTAKFDLTIFIEPHHKETKVACEFNSDLFEKATVDRLLGHFRAFLEAVAENPATRIGAVPLLGESERRQVLVEWNDTRRPIPPACVHELFEAQAERTPGAVAIISRDQRLTYAELNRRANRVAHHLRGLGVGENSKVGVCLDRSNELIVALLGILKAGGAYVPLAPGEPSERLAFMLTDSDARVLLTDNSFKWLPLYGIQAVPINSLLSLWAEDEDTNSLDHTAPDSPAYVMYTSGSTGKPKGVEVPHRGIVRLLFAQDYARMDEREVVLQLAPPQFDASTFEIWAPLLHGGRCVVCPAVSLTARELGGVLQEFGVTTLWLTSTLFNTVVDEDPSCLSTLRQLLIGGEALSIPHVRRALQALPGLRLTNGYGPTECTTFSCAYSIPRELPAHLSSIPIGRPITNTQVYILDRYMQPAPVGVPGDLHIGGPGVARGYINRPELTAECFIPNPFSDAPGELMYKTGDLARYLPDGTIEFMGRKDGQVKIRGFRIESTEIEAALAGHPNLKAAAIAVRESGPSGKQLVAYVVARNGYQPAPQELRLFLRQKLPDYMIPSEWMFLRELPRLGSGKLDRKSLPPLDRDRAGFARTIVAPRNAAETELVKIWEEVLGKHPISVRDNFFDLGGHSLLAVRLITAVEQSFGRKLHLSDLIRSPSIENLAALLRSSKQLPTSSVVPIQKLGTRPPLFCVHGGGGHVLRFLPLALELGSEQPFYGLRSPDFEGVPGEVTVERLAEIYLDEIRTVQKDGPYYLAGASFGGLVAYEMACRLEAQGQKVALVALFDTANPTAYKSIRLRESLNYKTQSLLFKLQRYRGRFVRAPFSTLVRQGWEIINSIRARLAFLVWSAARAVCRWMKRPLPFIFQDNLKLFTVLARDYTPKPYPGRVILFKAADQKAILGPDPELGWGSVAKGGVESYEVPGDHMTILDRPRVAKLAEELKRFLKSDETDDSPLPSHVISKIA